MTALTRRQFFAKVCDELVDQIPLRQTAATPTSSWAEIGRMAQCEPGKTLEAEAHGSHLKIISDSNGVWAEKDSGERIAIQASPRGHLLANVEQSWPKTRILSHATYEPIDLKTEELKK